MKLKVENLGLEELSVSEAKDINGGVISYLIVGGVILVGVGIGLGIAYLTRY